MFRYPAEIKLLLCCTRTHISKETVQRVRKLIQDGVDWNNLIQAGIQHKVLPLLYRTLKKTFPQEVPDHVMERLQHDFIINANVNFSLTGELLRIIALFENHGILAIPFKGPVLSESVYGDLALRSIGDLDILVHKHNAIKALNLLISQGYRPEVELDAEQKKSYLQTEYSIDTMNTCKRVIVELHWELTGRHVPYSFCLEQFEDRLKPATLAGKNIYQFPHEELLVYLCFHGSKDCWDTLESITIINELIRSHHKMNWIRVMNLAGRMHCKRVLFLGLSLASDLLGAPLPASLLKEIKSDPNIEKISENIYDTLSLPRVTFQKQEIRSDFSSFHLKIRDHWSDRIRYCISLFFRPSRQEWRSFRLPAASSFLHYFLRPVRLAWGRMVIFFQRIAL
jgi:hypothetical protein